MAHIQRRCSKRACRKVVPSGTRRCPACGTGRSVWVARVRGPDGAERGKAFRTRIEAERFTAGSEISKARGEWVDPALGRISLDDWMSAWLHAVAPALKPKTVRSYDSLISSRIAPAIGNYPIGNLGLAVVSVVIVPVVRRSPIRPHGRRRGSVGACRPDRARSCPEPEGPSALRVGGARF